MKDLQDMYDIVKKGLLEQNALSMDPGNTICAYRGSESRKCGIGLLITDEAYNEDLEEHGAGDKKVLNALSASGCNIENKLFFEHIQMIHDNASVELWEDELESMAAEYNLQP